MQTFDDAVRAAKDAKTSIAALTQAENKARESLSDLRVEFAKEEARLIDSVALYQKQAHEARAALQSALQRINDAPIEEQAAAQPAEAVSGLAIDDVCVASADNEEVYSGDYPGFEPLSESALLAVTGFRS
jgi:hypothetical protein